MKDLIELLPIRDDESGYNLLFKIAAYMMSNPQRHFDFDFKGCSILDQNAVAMLGGLSKYIHAHDNMLGLRCGVMFRVDSMSDLIRNKLINNNFLSHFTSERFDGYPSGDYIGYREHTEYLDVTEIALHLNNEWLSDSKISVTPALKNAVVGRIFEIFANAYGHGAERSKIGGLGVFSCGQYNKKEGQLKLTVLDFGAGIIENVKRHLGSIISDIDAMKWALITGNTTKSDSLDEDMARGLGFGLLSEFVSVNQGKLKIFSNTCWAESCGVEEYEVKTMKTPFNGTMVSITINCDDRHYGFLSELDASKQYF
jgi:hypothetical protein